MADLAYGEVYTVTRAKGIQGMSPIWGTSSRQGPQPRTNRRGRRADNPVSTS